MRSLTQRLQSIMRSVALLLKRWTQFKLCVAQNIEAKAKTVLRTKFTSIKQEQNPATPRKEKMSEHCALKY